MKSCTNIYHSCTYTISGGRHSFILSSIASRPRLPFLTPHAVELESWGEVRGIGEPERVDLTIRGYRSR